VRVRLGWRSLMKLSAAARAEKPANDVGDRDERPPSVVSLWRARRAIEKGGDPWGEDLVGLVRVAQILEDGVLFASAISSKKEAEESMSTTMTVSFYECEHEGDLENYVEDLLTAGAKVLATTLNEQAETGSATIEVADRAAFIKRFQLSNSYGFASFA